MPFGLTSTRKQGMSRRDAGQRLYSLRPPIMARLVSLCFVRLPIERRAIRTK